MRIEAAIFISLVICYLAVLSRSFMFLCQTFSRTKVLRNFKRKVITFYTTARVTKFVQKFLRFNKHSVALSLWHCKSFVFNKTMCNVLHNTSADSLSLLKVHRPAYLVIWYIIYSVTQGIWNVRPLKPVDSKFKGGIWRSNSLNIDKSLGPSGSVIYYSTSLSVERIFSIVRETGFF